MLFGRPRSHWDQAKIGFTVNGADVFDHFKLIDMLREEHGITAPIDDIIKREMDDPSVRSFQVITLH
jgi:hypothetical protein